MGSKRSLLVAVGAACLVLGPIAWREVREATSGPVTPAPVRLAESATGEPVSSGTALAPRPVDDDEPRDEPGPKPTTGAVAREDGAHDSNDPTFVFVRELEGAAERGDTSKLAGLLSRRLDADPEASAPLIRTIGHLAALAPAREKDRAATTLAKWLDEQTRETTVFARGNVSLLVDALADTGSLTAVEPLVRLLDTGSLAIHQATRAVEALAALGDGRAREAIVRFANRIDAIVVDEGLPGDELRGEAKEATRRALEALPERG